MQYLWEYRRHLRCLLPKPGIWITWACLLWRWDLKHGRNASYRTWFLVLFGLLNPWLSRLRWNQGWNKAMPSQFTLTLLYDSFPKLIFNSFEKCSHFTAYPRLSVSVCHSSQSLGEVQGDKSGLRQHFVDFDFNVLMSARFCLNNCKSGRVGMLCCAGYMWWNTRIKVNKLQSQTWLGHPVMKSRQIPSAQSGDAGDQFRICFLFTW